MLGFQMPDIQIQTQESDKEPLKQAGKKHFFVQGIQTTLIMGSLNPQKIIKTSSLDFNMPFFRSPVSQDRPRATQDVKVEALSMPKWRPLGCRGGSRYVEGC